MARHKRKAPRRKRVVMNEKNEFGHVDRLTKEQIERIAAEQRAERQAAEGRDADPTLVAWGGAAA